MSETQGQEENENKKKTSAKQGNPKSEEKSKGSPHKPNKVLSQSRGAIATAGRRHSAKSREKFSGPQHWKALQAADGLTPVPKVNGACSGVLIRPDCPAPASIQFMIRSFSVKVACPSSPAS